MGIDGLILLDNLGYFFFLLRLQHSTYKIQTPNHTVRIQINPTRVSTCLRRCAQRRYSEGTKATGRGSSHLCASTDRRRTAACVLPCTVLRRKNPVFGQRKW